MKPIFIIEHLEPRLWHWCLIEYKHISKIVGKKNLWFTNVKKGSTKLSKYGKVMKNSVRVLKLKNACVLDPEAKKTLSPKDKFDYLIFGGILGDYPPKKRTKKELTKFIKNAAVRNIGKEQMSTDNAVYTVHEIVNGKNFKNLKFQDNLSIEIEKGLSLDLPYRYNLVKGKPLISKELLNHLKRKRGF